MKNIIYILFLAPLFSTGQTCWDGIQNGDETGIDCGGSCQYTCVNGSAVLAFEGAEGAGKYTEGGRGGTVYVVTNLNDSGAGSYRAAIEATGDRIVVFKTGGTIFLESQILQGTGGLTILGHSAPEDSGGITIANYSTRFQRDQLIVRYMRFRLGDGGYKDEFGNVNINPNTSLPYTRADIPDQDTFTVLGGGHGIVDHVSVSWGIDENMGIAGTGPLPLTNFTIQKCLNTEALYDSHHEDGGVHGMSILIFTQTPWISLLQNMFVNNANRNPRVRSLNGVEHVNNIHYHVYDALIAGGTSNINMYKNVYKKGPTTGGSTLQLLDYSTDIGDETDSNIYVEGNYYDLPNMNAEWDSRYNGLILGAPYEPINSHPTVLDTVSVRTTIPLDVGANYPFVDSVDQRALDSYANGTGTIIDTQEEVGGWPTLAVGTAWTDTDSDGMRDDVETALFGNLTQTSSGDFYGDGRSNIEYVYDSLLEEGDPPSGEGKALKARGGFLRTGSGWVKIKTN